MARISQAPPLDPIGFGAVEHSSDDVRGAVCGTALSRAQSGDRRAFAELVCVQQRSVYGLALRALGRRADAEDLVQEVFLELHLHLDRIESPAHLGFWLRRTTAHRAIDRLRQRRRRPEPENLETLEEAAHLGAASAPDEDPLLVRRLERLLAELPAVPRLVVILRYQADLDPLDIARTLGLRVNTVKSHLKRSLARLRAECGCEDIP